MDSDQYGTAIHEAGHAVLGRVLRMVCGPATIVPNADENTAGFAVIDGQWRTWEYWFDTLGKHREMVVVYRAGIMALMAGAEAEKELLGRHRGGDGFDQSHIAHMAHEIWDTFGEDWPRQERRMRRQTARLIRKHRDKIKRVADALMVRRELSASEIDVLIAG